MIKKISKTILLVCSIVTASVIGFLFDNDTSSKSTLSALQEPIFSIETAHADGAGGDCCCSSDWPATSYPDAATVYVSDPEFY